MSTKQLQLLGNKASPLGVNNFDVPILEEEMPDRIHF